MPSELLSAYSPNQIKILNHIRQEGKITRSELTEVSGFKLLTVTKTVSRFLEDGIIIEAGHESSTGGRKATLLSINPHFRYTLAVDLGSSRTHIGVVGMDGSIVEQKVLTPGSSSIVKQNASAEELLPHLRALVKKYGKKNILGLGIGISGVVHHDEGRIVFCPNLRAWNDIDVNKTLGEALEIPVFVDTAARCMALAEYTLGAGKGIPNQISISIGNSVAAGIIIDGQVYRGADGAAGEIGHTSVRSDGALCTCGNSGCLEMYVTQGIITKTVEKTLATFRGFSPLKAMLKDRTMPTPDEIRIAAEQGDKVALDVLNCSAVNMATAIGYLANILNPSLIVLGGSTINSFPTLAKDIERIVRHRGFTVTHQNLTIRTAKLADSAGMVGAALQVIDDFF